MARKATTGMHELVAGAGPLSRKEVSQLRRGDIVSINFGKDRGILNGFIWDIEKGSIWEGGPIGMIVLYLLVPLWLLGEVDHVCQAAGRIESTRREGTMDPPSSPQSKFFWSLKRIFERVLFFTIFFQLGG